MVVEEVKSWRSVSETEGRGTFVWMASAWEPEGVTKRRESLAESEGLGVMATAAGMPRREADLSLLPGERSLSSRRKESGKAEARE